MPPPTTNSPSHASSEIAALTLAEEIGVSTESLVLGVLEQSEDCIKMLSPAGELEYMNCGGLAAMQIPDFSMVSGSRWWELWPEESQLMIRQMFERCMCGIEVSFEAACPTAQGVSKRWSVKLKPMVTPDARVTGALCTSREIA